MADHATNAGAAESRAAGFIRRRPGSLHPDLLPDRELAQLPARV